MLTRRTLLAATLSSTPIPAQSRTITDMAHRPVALPDQIRRVVTLGSLPVLNSFVYAMAEGAT